MDGHAVGGTDRNRMLTQALGREAFARAVRKSGGLIVRGYQADLGVKAPSMRLIRLACTATRR
jgi:hypothetical protein